MEEVTQDATETADVPTIHRALSAVMRDMEAVAKSGFNQAQRFKFRAIDDVMTAAHGPLSRHGVIVVPEVMHHEFLTRTSRNNDPINVAVVRICYRFYGPAGDWVEAVVMGEGADSADKATNKAMAAALKYALLQVLMIPVADEGDAEHPEGAPSGQQTSTVSHPESTPSEKQIGTIKGMFRRIGYDADDAVLAATVKFTGRDLTSLTDLTRLEASNLIDALKKRAEVTS